MAYALFDTPIGVCAIAWSRAGLTGVQLPEANEAATRARIARRGGTETPPSAEAEHAITAICALLSGEKRDLADLDLDWSGTAPFHRSVYEAARAIPPGKTRTYGEIARAIGEPDAARAVGQSLGRNPWPIVVPCHRVVAAHGANGGFSAHGGVATKLRLLAIEGAPPPGGPSLFGDLPQARRPQR